MLTISTIPEALAELEKQTGRAWTESELFDVATKYGVELHAAPPTGAKTTIEKFVDGVGMIQTIPKMPTMDFDYLMAPCVTTNHPARLAVLFPSQVEQLWLSGEVFTRHSHRHDEVEDETIVFFDPVRVTREQVRIKAATLKKILSVWNMAQAGQGKRYRGPEWMFQAAQPAPAQNTATPAPVESGSDGPAPAVPNWKMRVQTEATELFLRLLASGANPTPHSLVKPMAQWCRDNDIFTDGGINPSDGYLRTHVLGGGHWTPPTMSREQAKKHVAQVAQTKVAQVAQQHT